MYKLIINIMLLFFVVACSSGEFQNDGTDRGKIVTYKTLNDGTDRYAGVKTETEVKETIVQTKSVEVASNDSVEEKEEKIYYLDEGDKSGEENFFYPIEKPVVSRDFGEESLSGIEFRINQNEKIYAAAPGMVIFSGVRPSLGNSVFVYHNNGYVSIYTNLDTINYKKGDYIRDINSIVGTANDKFNFELRKRTDKGVVPINPKKYLVFRN
jgi:murein DD-endopeptidase MepM/ murein hydrolase activator NlpD